jgi:hypothetical protein
MARHKPKKFYVGIHLEDGEPVGHVVTIGSPPTADAKPPLPEPQAEKTPPQDVPVDFDYVLQEFFSVIDVYRKFISLTLSIAPIISMNIAATRIGEFVKAHGRCLDDKPANSLVVYELNMSIFREFTIRNDEVTTALEGAAHLPEVMVIGLVSAYDAFLTRLLRVVFHKQSDLVLTSNKTIKFSDLLKFNSIDDARISLIDREIETAMRSSHHEQIKFMEDTFKLGLTPDLKDVLPRFVELCERRNLLTHTGGVVSKQYINNCSEHKYDVSKVKPGEKLEVDAAYFSRSVDIINEIGVKICYVLWHKYAKTEGATADNRFNSHCVDLMNARAYGVAESLLKFATKTDRPKLSESTRLMMTINLANAIRLQDRSAEANKVLEKEDWSATASEFRLCAASVKGDIDTVIGIMKKLGRSGSINADEYRQWPVFRKTRTDERFVKAFEEIFDEPFIFPVSTDVVQRKQLEDVPKKSPAAKTK